MGNTSRIQNVSAVLPYSSGSYSGFFGLGLGKRRIARVISFTWMMDESGTSSGLMNVK
jgi:hypothetical protein